MIIVILSTVLKMDNDKLQEHIIALLIVRRKIKCNLKIFIDQ